MRYLPLLAVLLPACFDLNGSSWGGPGEPCYTNEPRCEKGLTCSDDGICRSVPPDTRPTCTLSTDCDDGFACDNGRCTAYAFNCAGDSDCRPDYFCSAQVCAKRLPIASVCDHASQCASGACADGVCCDRQCTGTCEACAQAKTGAADGTCANIAEGNDPDDECASEVACTGAGTCALKTLGAECRSGPECTSTHCADGVCCNAPCDGVCQACDAGGACGSVKSKEDPGTCDDANRGPSCAQIPCVCDNAGDCKSGGGTSCTMTTECGGGLFCVDHVCCNELCDGSCEGCTASRTGVASGTCAPIPNGQDPDSECSGPTTCDGAGGCYNNAPGASCLQDYECTTGHCDSETWYSTEFMRVVTVHTCCDNVCPDSCYSCRGFSTGAAAGTCAPMLRHTDVDNSCSGSLQCDGAGQCMKANGSLCTSSTQCQSDNCSYVCNQDGFCNTYCN